MFRSLPNILRRLRRCESNVFLEDLADSVDLEVVSKCFLENAAFFVKITAYYQPSEIEKYIIFQPIKKISYKKPAHIFVKYYTKFKELPYRKSIKLQIIEASLQ